MAIKNFNVAVVVGHDKNKPGAFSPFLKESEYIYNSEVATHLSMVADIYKRPIGNGYMTQMKELSEILNPKKYDLVLGLHFNKYDNKANEKGVGCEAIIYPNSSSRIFAQALVDDISNHYNIPNRGVKEHGEGDRGYGFLSLINAPAVIIEPFFGDEREALKFENKEEYASIIEDVICEFYGT